MDMFVQSLVVGQSVGRVEENLIHQGVSQQVQDETPAKFLLLLLLLLLLQLLPAWVMEGEC